NKLLYLALFNNTSSFRLAQMYCAFPTVERVPCGPLRISKLQCNSMGCCWDQVSSSCFYPMDECTNDHHFVFSIHHDTTSVRLNPSSLFIPGTNCKPVILTDTVAVFKFKFNECGTRAFVS
uniref:P-type domain-containing protein n=1 Tax=Periophthalmus magnuspinnatus TaxID=409849 RepID=A0A3B4BA07_9GOBI